MILNVKCINNSNESRSTYLYYISIFCFIQSAFISSNSYADFSVYTNPKSFLSTSNTGSNSNTDSSSSSDSGSNSAETIIIISVICGTVGIVFIVGGITICTICIVRASKGKQDQDAQNTNSNTDGRNYKIREDNNVAGRSVEADNQNQDNGNYDQPNACQTRFSDLNSIRQAVPTRTVNNDNFDHNAMELGYSSWSNIENKNNGSIPEGRPVNYEIEKTMDGGEMPVNHTKE